LVQPQYVVGQSLAVLSVRKIVLCCALIKADEGE